MAAKPAQKQRRRGPGRPFKPGQSGNPRGKSPGTKHRLTLLAERLLADDVQAVVAEVVKAAKAGDMSAARLILDRVLPPRKGRPVTFALPEVNSASGVTRALAAIAAAMADGVLTPEEAAAVAAVIETQRRALETLELEARMSKIEAQINNAQNN